MKKPVVVDLFAGAGGEGVGLLQAFTNMGMTPEMIAINHWKLAIDTHKLNLPEARHIPKSVQDIQPLNVVKRGRVKMLWASPECIFHSNARGGRPMYDQSRSSSWLVLKWLEDLYVENGILENVPEFRLWGPLDTKGYPIKSGKGKTFEAFLNAIRSMGYHVDWRILNCADYGVPQTRRRIFIQFKKKHLGPIQWPEPTHAKGGVSDLISELPAWIPAHNIIDWNDLGPSIRGRKKPLCENTLRRIETGIRKYWGEFAEPFIVILRGNSNVNAITDPLSTITASGGHHALVTPVPLIDKRYGTGVVNSVEDSMSTVTSSGNHHALITPLLLHQMSGGGARPVSNPVPTVLGTGSHSIITPLIVKYYGKGLGIDSVNDPLATVTTGDRFGLITPKNIDIRYRMFKVDELARAQSFPEDYEFLGGKTAQKKQIGNAVPPKMARVLAEAALA